MDWGCFVTAGHPLTEALLAAFAPRAGPPGTVIALGGQWDVDARDTLLSGAHAALQRGGPLIFVHSGAAGAALARSVHLEHPEQPCVIVQIPEIPAAAAWAAHAVARHDCGYREIRYDAAGQRHRPELELLDVPPAAATPPISPGEVCLVSGGGKGVGFECALALARATGCRLALLDRTAPDADAEVVRNLERLQAAGVPHVYVHADVCAAGMTGAAIRRVQVEFGPVIALLHCAAVNEPALFTDITVEALEAHMAPKAEGLANVLTALETRALRLLIAFGSILARTGHGGQAHYALANERLGLIMRQYRAELPHCRCVTIEWSVWSETGIAARLGAVDAVLRAGITPIPTAVGTSWFLRIAACPTPSPEVVVTGRMGDLRTMPTYNAPAVNSRMYRMPVYPEESCTL
jgi:enediyne polyketide synthase